MTTLAITGAAGRMGGALIRCAHKDAGLTVAVALDREGHEDLGRDAGVLAGVGEIGVLLSSDPRGIAAADVVIDFSSHLAVPVHAALAAELGKGIVIGTTGLDDDEARLVRVAAQRIPIVWAPNMSLGVNVLFDAVEKVAAALGMDYDVEIVETHHRLKKDAPSGTALRLGQRVAQGRGQDLAQAMVHGREGMVGERPRGEIGMHAVRAGDVVGDHTVLFATDCERIELTHRASSRDVFAIGALRAATWVAGATPRAL